MCSFMIVCVLLPRFELAVAAGGRAALAAGAGRAGARARAGAVRGGGLAAAEALRRAPRDAAGGGAGALPAPGARPARPGRGGRRLGARARAPGGHRRRASRPSRPGAGLLRRARAAAPARRVLDGVLARARAAPCAGAARARRRAVALLRGGRRHRAPGRGGPEHRRAGAERPGRRARRPAAPARGDRGAAPRRSSGSGIATLGRAGRAAARPRWPTASAGPGCSRTTSPAAATRPLRPRAPGERLEEALELPRSPRSGEQLGRALGLLVDRLLARRERRGRTLRAVVLSARAGRGRHVARARRLPRGAGRPAAHAPRARRPPRAAARAGRVAAAGASSASARRTPTGAALFDDGAAARAGAAARGGPPGPRRRRARRGAARARRRPRLARAGAPRGADAVRAVSRRPTSRAGSRAPAVPRAVRAGDGGRPLRRRRPRRSTPVRESWLVEDRWWTDRPLRRRYWEVVTVDGRDLVVFRDLDDGGWYRAAVTPALREVGTEPRPPVTRRPAASRHAPRAARAEQGQASTELVALLLLVAAVLGAPRWPPGRPGRARPWARASAGQSRGRICLVGGQARSRLRGRPRAVRRLDPADGHRRARRPPGPAPRRRPRRAARGALGRDGRGDAARPPRRRPAGRRRARRPRSGSAAAASRSAARRARRRSSAPGAGAPGPSRRRRRPTPSCAAARGRLRTPVAPGAGARAPDPPPAATYRELAFDVELRAPGEGARGRRGDAARGGATPGGERATPTARRTVYVRRDRRVHRRRRGSRRSPRRPTAKRREDYAVRLWAATARPVELVVTTSGRLRAGVELPDAVAPRRRRPARHGPPALRGRVAAGPRHARRAARSRRGSWPRCARGARCSAAPVDVTAALRRELDDRRHGAGPRLRRRRVALGRSGAHRRRAAPRGRRRPRRRPVAPGRRRLARSGRRWVRRGDCLGRRTA